MTDRDTTSPTIPGGRPLNDFALNRANFRSTGLFADPDVGLGFGSSDYPDMSMTAIPGATTPDDIQLESGPALSLVNPGNRGFTPSGTQIAPEAATVTPTENFESTRAMLESNVFDPDTLDPRGDQIVSPTGTGIGQKITPPKAGSSSRTGVDPQADQYRSSVNAAEAAYLQEALGNMDDPNFAEQVINKVIRNLTFNMYDPDDPQKREDAKAILDAYETLVSLFMTAKNEP
jgi:hypothetical protein